ncbi:MAG: HAMP domain-containing histidine kinase [Clostridia bacterium]|nr:HAMP domain-containing histidine kinase [Clostridia bacterium]
MIQKLRRKFVFILMGVVTLILLAAFISVLISTSSNIQHTSQTMLRQALKLQPSQQVMDSSQVEGGQNPSDPVLPKNRMPIMVAEIHVDGTVSFLASQLQFIDEEEAKAAVLLAMNSPEDSGILHNYALRFQKSDDKIHVALADISMEQSMLKGLIINSLMIGAAALVVFFFISILLSRWAVRPVELAWEKQRQFVADASHELKTPLTVILSNAEMLSASETFTDERKSRRMEHILAEAVLMKELVDNLLTLAKSDDTKDAIVRECIDFSFLITNAILAFEAIAFDNRIKLTYKVQDNVFVGGDAQHLRQLLSILLDNAIKYCPSGGLIRISLKEMDKKTALLTVFNEGKPIPKEEIAKIFQRFYRIDQSRSAYGSFGLGLAIAESIVSEHGGKIWAESEEIGNSFFVTLPYYVC